LFLATFALAGCETAPPDTAEYWSDTQPESAPPWAQATYLTVRVHDGDTLADIAGRYSVSRRTIERMNDLSDGDDISAGQTLKLPAGSKQTRKAVLSEASQPHYESWNAPGPTGTVTVKELGAPVVHHAPQAEGAQPKSKNLTFDSALAEEASAEIAKATVAKSAKKDAATADKTTTAKAATTTTSKAESTEPKAEAAPTPTKESDAAASSGAFEWPVQGKVIARFGKDDDGERNDGINIATDLGTPIHAAADGTVTYAGNELKSYGNLILIKHENGYVTAYAHAQRIAVSRGDHVAQGDVIGYAGQTGDVTSPQVHFEIRQGVKPVDPRPLLVAARET